MSPVALLINYPSPNGHSRTRGHLRHSRGQFHTGGNNRLKWSLQAPVRCCHLPSCASLWRWENNVGAYRVYGCAVGKAQSCKEDKGLTQFLISQDDPNLTLPKHLLCKRAVVEQQPWSPVPRSSLSLSLSYQCHRSVHICHKLHAGRKDSVETVTCFPMQSEGGGLTRGFPLQNVSLFFRKEPERRETGFSRCLQAFWL